MTKESIWIPVGIAACFWGIQAIEGNFLNPKIVGGKLNINVLAAILSLIVGGYLWDIAGMILFLPFAAIFKVFCSYFEELKPLDQLMGDELYEARMNKNKRRKKLSISKLLGRS